MFGLGATELFIVVVLVALALFIVPSGLSTWVNVDQRWRVASQGIDLERWLLTTLNSCALGSIAATGVGRISIRQRRTPLWTVLLAVLTFPVGLLLLLYKAEEILTVMITSDERGGSRIDVLGVTREHTRDALTNALVSEHSAEAEPVNAGTAG